LYLSSLSILRGEDVAYADRRQYANHHNLRLKAKSNGSSMILQVLNLLLFCMSTAVLAMEILSVFIQLVKIMLAPESWTNTATERASTAAGLFKALQYVKNTVFSVEVRFFN
jgi:hypothetical protein